VAKAAEIDVSPFEPYALAAARVVRVRADELFAHAEGVLDALGERRDPDVHIEAMEAFEQEVQAAVRPGIDALVARLRGRQARGNDTLAAALEHVGESDLHARLHSLADGAEELVA
jgi:hypothetical protein